MAVHLLELSTSWVLQQHNDPEHQSKSTIESFQTKKIHLLERPSQSPDLNPAEMWWNDPKRATHTRHPNNMSELKQFYRQGWNKLPPEQIAGLIWKHLLEVIAAKRSTVNNKWLCVYIYIYMSVINPPPVSQTQWYLSHYKYKNATCTLVIISAF